MMKRAEAAKSRECFEVILNHQRPHGAWRREEKKGS